MLYIIQRCAMTHPVPYIISEVILHIWSKAVNVKKWSCPSTHYNVTWVKREARTHEMIIGGHGHVLADRTEARGTK